MEITTPPPMVSADDGVWCVLAVWSGQEFNVQRDIGDMFQTYLPLETRMVVIRGRKLKKVAPLIRNYIFVRVDLDDDNWGSLEHVKGSLGLLKNNDKPMSVPDTVIERIRTAEAAGVFDQSIKSAFQTGQSVEITEGPFAGLIGKIKSASPRKRARLLLSSFGDVEIDTAFLKKVSL